jgi:tetratricopeptide (TPR) repeat protein
MGFPKEAGATRRGRVRLATARDMEHTLAEAATLVRAGRFAEAERTLQPLRKAAAGDPRLLHLDLEIFQGMRRFPELAAAYRALLARGPSNLDLWVGLALALIQAGQGSEAYEAAQKARTLNPKSLRAMQAFAVSAMAAKDWKAAVQAFEFLTRAEPKAAAYYQEWSKAEFELDNVKRAIKAFEKFLDLTAAPAPEHFFTLGKLYFIARKPETAAAHLDRAIAGGMAASELFAVRAHCHLHLGEMAEAKARFEKALALNPDNLEAALPYRQMVKTPKGDPVFARLEALTADPDLNETKRIHAGFLLGNLYHGIGEYDRAFENYRKGNEANRAKYQREGFGYDRKKTEAEFAELTSAFPADAFKKWYGRGSFDPRPVFIVGLPRSGTTLLEQIVAAHSMAEGRGELDEMHYIHFEFDTARKAPGGDLGAILEHQEKVWQDRYLAAIATRDPKVARVTDKMPANVKSLGLIALLFPKARVLYLRRDPRDVALSIYFNIFDKGHPYATSLADIAHYIGETEKLARHWQRVLPLPFLEIRYEDIVAAQEKKTREILQFLDLPWEEACLAFHTQARAAMTMSSVQVRQPLSKSSIGRWRHYRAHLDPLFAALGEGEAPNHRPGKDGK